MKGRCISSVRAVVPASVVPALIRLHVVSQVSGVWDEETRQRLSTIILGPLLSISDVCLFLL